MVTPGNLTTVDISTAKVRRWGAPAKLARALSFPTGQGVATLDPTQELLVGDLNEPLQEQPRSSEDGEDGEGDW